MKKIIWFQTTHAYPTVELDLGRDEETRLMFKLVNYETMREGSGPDGQYFVAIPTKVEVVRVDGSAREDQRRWAQAQVEMLMAKGLLQFEVQHALDEESL